MNNFFPMRKQIETKKILKQLNKSSRALAELKMYFKYIVSSKRKTVSKHLKSLEEKNRQRNSIYKYKSF